ncbi:Glutathione-regulated potassium-efflux system protein KefC [Pseudomonas fluorescens]|nr:Glutathione-regulated potassium-efflux system protein KefC [Pseudomonas fluorescens]VVO96442.1 Glutathione-regulated potassium-efflux system protein KefC [Pseudomonas fluorescens]VVP25168.1 Glutathione-regulated potassium-efflux system protein KefC [Pseudomonas fluorescens]
MSCGFELLVLHHDPGHIEALRKFGAKVFYGDATRLDLAHAAGAIQAVMLITPSTIRTIT